MSCFWILFFTLRASVLAFQEVVHPLSDGRELGLGLSEVGFSVGVPVLVQFDRRIDSAFEELRTHGVCCGHA